MKFKYLKVYKNGDKSVSHIEAQTVETAKLMIKKLAPCTGTIKAVYSLHDRHCRTMAAAIHYDDIDQLELIWEAQNA